MEVAQQLAPDAWRAALREFGPAGGDVYFQPEYHRLHEVNGDGIPAAWMMRDGEHKLLVAGLRTNIPSSLHWDLQTCNGYGGPLANEEADPGFLAAAWDAWRAAAGAEGCVAAFLRLHPLLDNQRWLPAGSPVREDRATVFVPLAGDSEAALEAADVRHRNPVSKARREGMEVRWNQTEDWRDFAGLYARAMERAAAASSLRFSPGYFTELAGWPAAVLGAVRIAGRLVAGAVFLFGDGWAHYHLAAREADAPSAAANLLLQAGLELAADRGLAGMHLGGGRTPAADDGLLRFKRHLGGEVRCFRVGLVVALADEFAALTAAWAARAGAKPGWLLGYRQPLPAH